jgi:transposase
MSPRRLTVKLIQLLRALPLATTADDYEALLPWKISIPTTR